MTLLLVTIAGAFGCVVRYLFEYSVRRHHPTLRPWATVAANVLAAALTGYVAYQFLASSDAHLRSVVLTGFCGGLSTFSSAFAIPAILQREHHWGYSVALVVTTPLLCSAAFVVGVSLAH